MERTVAATELRMITRLRVAKALGLVTVSTHILDAVAGHPAAGVSVALSMLDAERIVAAGRGRASPTPTAGSGSRAATPGGAYRLTFATGLYFADRGVATFYPEVVITFSDRHRGEAAPGHYHVPLLLSPYAYSTYRGS